MGDETPEDDADIGQKKRVRQRGEDEAAHQKLEDEARPEAHVADEPGRLAHQHQPCLQPALEPTVSFCPVKCENGQELSRNQLVILCLRA